MRYLLDKLFQNKKLSILVPIALSVLFYLLFLAFGKGEEKTELLITTPIVTVITYFGVFLVLYVQVKNPMCPERFLNFFELLTVVCTALYDVIYAVRFIASGFQKFEIILCFGPVIHSAVSWAHSKRTK